MRYEKEIIRVLMEAGGKGLPIYKIARHVFNARNSLFDDMRYDDVYQSVYSYIRQHTGKHDSFIMKSDEKQGQYAINMNPNNQQQLIVWLDDSHESDNADDQGNERIDLSLSLFPDDFD